MEAGDRTVNVTGNYQLDTTNEVNIQAPSKITLTCGGSSVAIEPGKITISAGGGASITLDGNAIMISSTGDQISLDGKATLKSPAQANVEAPITTVTGGGSTMKADAAGVTITAAKISLN